MSSRLETPAKEARMTRDLPIDAAKRAPYASALRALRTGDVDFLVGGGFALFVYLDRWRTTKDLDVFLRPADVGRALDALRSAGFDVELTDPAWLAKARIGGLLVDLIFCSYNGILPVDDTWFDNARDAVLLDVPVRLIGPEEMIVSKCFVAARDRFDGADISWMIRTLGDQLDWERIERRFGTHWEVLLWQLVHYRYVFPANRQQVPAALAERLLRRASDEVAAGRALALECRGPMFDQIHYRPAEELTSSI
jgi:hypothetical protein